MKISILGAGAMGSLYASLLTEGGADVTLIDKYEDRASWISKYGIKITGVEGIRVVRVRAIAEPSAVKSTDILMIAVKSYDTEKAVKNVLPYLPHHATLLTIQNGLGNLEVIGNLAYKNQVLAGVTLQASTLIRKAEIHHAAQGVTVIGEPDGRITEEAKEICREFNRCGIEARISRNILGMIWTKLLINAGINAVSALTGLKNGELLNISELRMLIRKAVLEGSKVAKALNLNLDVDDPVQATFEAAKATEHNKSSMLQDIERGRSTEVEWINGGIGKIAAGLGIPTPVNDTLISLVKALEKKMLLEAPLQHKKHA